MKKELIPLSHVPLRVAAYTNRPAPSPRKTYELVLRGIIPATFNDGRWFVREMDIPKAAEAFGLEVEQPLGQERVAPP